MKSAKGVRGPLQTSPAMAGLKKISMWDRKQNPTRAEVIDWLEHFQDQVVQSIPDIYAKKDLIRNAKERRAKKEITSGDHANLERQWAMMVVLLNTLEVFDGVSDIFEKDGDESRIMEAFIQGVRIGMLHERLCSFTDGRYQSLLTNKIGTSSGGKATKALTSKRDVTLLESTWAQFRGQPKALQKTANELLIRHRISGRGGKPITTKTLRERLKELKIWEST